MTIIVGGKKKKKSIFLIPQYLEIKIFAHKTVLLLYQQLPIL